MKVAEVTSRAVEIQQLKDYYLDNFKKEFEEMLLTCYLDLRSDITRRAPSIPGSKSCIVGGLGNMERVFNTSALVFIKFPPLSMGLKISSTLTSYLKSAVQYKSDKDIEITRKKFMNVIKTCLDSYDDENLAARVGHFVQDITSSLKTMILDPGSTINAGELMRELSYNRDVMLAQLDARNTMFFEHIPFLRYRFGDLQEITGIPPLERKKEIVRDDALYVLEHMVKNMSNFGISEEETDSRIIVDKIISYFSTHALSLELSHNAAVKIYQALLSSHEKDWHQDEEQQSLMIFQIKYLLRDELKAEIMDQIEKNPYYLKLLCRKIVSDLATQKHAELFVEHQETGRVADARKALAEYVPQMKSKVEFAFRANFLSDQEAIGQFLRGIYQSTEEQRGLAQKLIDAVKSQSVTAYQLGLEITQMLKSGIALDIQDSDGDSLLIIACKNQDIAKAKVILSYQSGKYSVNLFNNKGGTALMYAIKLKQEAMVQLLIKNNADVNARLGSDPILHMAIEARNDNIFDLLLSHDKIDIHATNAKSLAAIHKAVFYPYARMKLKALGADLGHEVALIDKSQKIEVNVSALHMILLTSNDLAEIDKALLPENSSFKDINDPIGKSGSNILMQNISHPERHEILKHLINHPRVKINHKDVSLNILHEALRLLDFDLAKHILEASAKRATAEQININHKTLSGYSPLHMIVLEMTMLAGLKALSDIESLSTSSMVEFGAEKYNKLYDLFRSLLDMGADINAPLPATSRIDLECRDSSLLHLAVKYKLNDVFNLLIDHPEIKLDSVNIDLETAIHFAAKSSDREMTIKILEKCSKTIIDMQNKYASTALHIALSQKNFDFARELIKLGADVNLENNDAHRPLDLMIIKYSECLQDQNPENLSLIKDLLDYLMNDPNINLSNANKCGRTYLHMAVLNNLEDISEKLLDKGIKISSDQSGYTEITYAVMANNPKLLKKMLQQEYDPICLDQYATNGATPLILALSFQNQETASMLIEAGASKLVKSLEGTSPINVAIEAKFSLDFVASFFDEVSQEKIEDYLLEKDSSERNILDYTYAYGGGDIIKFMEEKLLSLDQEKLLIRLNMSDFEKMSNYYASVAASCGNAEYFKMMPRETLETLVYKGEFGENGEYLADLVLRGYESLRSELVSKCKKTSEEANLLLKNYVDAIDLLYRPEMTLISYTKGYLANLGVEHQNPELLAMFMSKNAAALSVTHPTQVDALEFIEPAHEAVGNTDIHKLQGMESGFDGH